MKYILGLEVERINCPVVIRFGDSVTRVDDGDHLRDVDFENVCHSTAFHMRHKLLVFMEATISNAEPLEALIEADETYVLESKKGTRVTHRKPRKHGEGASKRRLSNEQRCICFATDREKHVVARCVNRAKPSSEDLANALAEHIAGQSLLLCDGATSYNYLAEKTDCEKISLVGHESYNKVYYLNTVNSLHSRFKEMLPDVSWCSYQVSQPLCRSVHTDRHER